MPKVQSREAPATAARPTDPLVVFTNPGEIDLRAIRFMGVNVKDQGRDTIGWFGTGLKFAIAVILRNRQEVEVWSGGQRYEFKSRLEVIRGKPFELVYMNEEPLGITTDLGKNWQLWQAFRELESNTRDEGGKTQEATASPQGISGTTTVIVRGRSFHDCWQKRFDYFLNPQSQPLYVHEGEVAVYAKQNNTLFYRGIKVNAPPRAAKYSYNLLRQSELSEDRNLAGHYSLELALAVAVVQSKDQDFIAEFLCAEKESFEWHCDLNWGMQVASEEFLDVVEGMFHRVSPTAKAVYLKARKREGEEYEDHQLSILEEKMLSRAKEFLGKAGYEDIYPIRVVKDLGENVLGRAIRTGRGKILLTARVFEMGTKQVASTLLEEYVHINRGFGDLEREMQNFLFDKIVSLIEELRGEPI